VTRTVGVVAHPLRAGAALRASVEEAFRGAGGGRAGGAEATVTGPASTAV
jgi:hypothetical protein